MTVLIRAEPAQAGLQRVALHLKRSRQTGSAILTDEALLRQKRCGGFRRGMVGQPIEMGVKAELDRADAPHYFLAMA